MDNSTYRKNVLKTLSVKPAKLSLRMLSRQTARMNILHAVIGIATETMEMQAWLAQYITGASKLTEAMKVRAFEEAGDVCYYVAVASKFLKAKIPGSGKKTRLKTMTRTEALLQLNVMAADMLDLGKKYFYGPVMAETDGKREKKVYELDAEGKKIPTGEMNGSFVVYKHTVVVEDVKVQTVDDDATEKLWAGREAKLKEILEQFAPLLWAFIYETFDVAPANVFVGNIAKLEKRYGQGFFTLAEAEDRDTDTELAAMTEVSGQASVTAGQKLIGD